MTEFWNNFKYIFVAFLVAGALVFAGIMTGCKTLKVFKVEGQPQSCNDMYTQMDWNLQTGVKDVALMTMWMTACQADRNYQKQKDCIKWVYMGKELDKTDYQRYAYYLECIK